MDALDFFKARKRMCEEENCESCKLYHMQGGCCVTPKYEEIGACEEAIAIVEQLANEHSTKTWQRVFLDQWSNASISYTDGFPLVNPCELDSDIGNECAGRKCSECRKAFWLAEVKE